jgi:hypothetical protein
VVPCIGNGQFEVVLLSCLYRHWQGVEQGGETIVAGVEFGGGRPPEKSDMSEKQGWVMAGWQEGRSLDST